MKVNMKGQTQRQEKNKGPKNLLCLRFHVTNNEQVSHFSFCQDVHNK